MEKNKRKQLPYQPTFKQDHINHFSIFYSIFFHIEPLYAKLLNLLGRFIDIFFFTYLKHFHNCCIFNICTVVHQVNIIYLMILQEEIQLPYFFIKNNTSLNIFVHKICSIFKIVFLGLILRTEISKFKNKNIFKDCDTYCQLLLKRFYYFFTLLCLKLYYFSFFLLI